MNDLILKDMLKARGLRATASRILLLNLFNTDHIALMHSEIRSHLRNKVDRVSVYRIVAVLVAHNILIGFVDNGGNELFILNRYKEVAEEIVPLVKCENCQRVPQLPSLPFEYEMILKQNKLSKQPIFHGLCTSCQV